MIETKYNFDPLDENSFQNKTMVAVTIELVTKINFLLAEVDRLKKQLELNNN